MIKPMFTPAQFDRWFEITEEKAEVKIYDLLRDTGEYFVKLARESGTYQDQTGNLRSSIGYVIVKDGTVLFKNFEKAGKPKAESKEPIIGDQVGERLATRIASGIKGFVLVGVAGMNYSVYVEAKGREVISGSVLQTEMLLRKSIKTIFDAAARNQANF